MERLRQSQTNPPVLSIRTIVISDAVVVLGTLATGTALFLAYPPVKGSEALDIIRTVAGLGAGTGDIAGLIRRPVWRSPLFWPGIRVDLNGAELHRFLFTHCQVRSAVFTGARFIAPAVFRGSAFDGQADFREAAFDGQADFREAAFDGLADFRRVRFLGRRRRSAVRDSPVKWTSARTLRANPTGAATSSCAGKRRKWPAGWQEEDALDASGWRALIRAAAQDPTAQAS